MSHDIHCISSSGTLLNRKALFVYSENLTKSINMWAKRRILDLLGLKYDHGFRNFR